MDLEQHRKFYAEEIKFVGRIEYSPVTEAFAKVPRERFLGKGPWRVRGGPGEGNEKYWSTADADPRHLYHNVLIAIDEARGLNNGLPVWLAGAMQAGRPAKGERVVHIGCGTGYYSAILAETVGENGSVTAIEVDPELAKRAERNLEYLSQVEVVCANGSTYNIEKSDLIFVNAGTTHLNLRWLESLKPGGRLLVPLTTDEGGQLLRITNEEAGYGAEVIQGVMIYPCAGMRDAESEALLKAAIDRNGWNFKGSVRLDEHSPEEECWLHSPTYCLSKHTFKG